jgi:phosphohistidine phosphatase
MNNEAGKDMKTILLMRHAKSSWKDSDLKDHDRPLNKRGQKDAPRMGMILCDRELIPQRILCSTALRARQTAEAIIKVTGFQGDAIYLDRLYMAEVEEYIAVLRELPDNIERVLVIGHNPGLETLLQLLSGQIESLPTAVIAHLALPIHQWTELNSEIIGELVDIWRPKEIPETPDVKKEPVKEKGKKKKKSQENARKKNK